MAKCTKCKGTRKVDAMCHFGPGCCSYPCPDCREAVEAKQFEVALSESKEQYGGAMKKLAQEDQQLWDNTLADGIE